jgi:hypothetical protein
MIPTVAGEYKVATMPEYIAAPALNSGVLQTFVSRCPQAAWFESWLNPNREREDTEATDIGTIAHAIVLEGSVSNMVEVNPELFPSRTTGSIPDGWTNKDIRNARDRAREDGKIPVLSKNYNAIRGMVDSVHRFIASLAIDEPEIWQMFRPNGGESELTILTDDDGTLCKIRPDKISVNRKIVADLKFTGVTAEPNAFGRQMNSMGYAMSAAFYRRMIRRAYGCDSDYYFIVCETMKPYLCSLVGVDPAWGAWGAARVQRGIRGWKHCVDTNRFPGYPTRVVYPELPPWLLRDEEGEIRIESPIDYGSQG